MNKASLKITAVVLIQCFLCSGALFASSGLKGIRIPEQLGNIKETFEVQNSSAEAGPTIIQIQDAHCNYEAQKNLAQILEYLIKEHNLKLVMVEGGSGDVSLSSLSSYADKKTRVEVAEKYLKMGKISGEEYLNIVSEQNFELYGVEDEELYKANLSAFWKADAIKEEGLRYLEDLSRIITSLESLVYGKELSLLEEKKSGYADKSIALVEYCRYLNEMAKQKNLELKDYPHLVAFSQIAQLEKEIDFKLAESQRNTFIQDLAKLLDEKGVEGLINKTQEFKAKRIPPEEYYSFLEAMAEQKLDLKQNYAQLSAYIKYITLSKEVNAPDLLKEVNNIEDKIREACFVNSEQRRLSQIANSIRILTKIFNLELTPEDYAYFQAHQSQFITANWIDFLTQNCIKYNLTMQPSSSNLIDENLQELDGFYRLGVEREKSIIENAVNKINASGEKIVVLITGGFHTPGITQMLKDKHYSYIVVTPAITQKADSSIYFSVLRGEQNLPEEAINEEE